MILDTTGRGQKSIQWRRRCDRGTNTSTTHSPPALRVGLNRPFQLLWFALELTGIRRPVLHIRRLERDDLAVSAFDTPSTSMPFRVYGFGGISICVFRFSGFSFRVKAPVRRPDRERVRHPAHLHTISVSWFRFSVFGFASFGFRFSFFGFRFSIFDFRIPGFGCV